MPVELEFLTPQEVADVLKVRVTTVYEWIRLGKLPASRLGNRYRVARADLTAFVERNKAVQEPSAPVAEP